MQSYLVIGKSQGPLQIPQPACIKMKQAEWAFALGVLSCAICCVAHELAAWQSCLVFHACPV